MEILSEHESFISDILARKTIKEELFGDFPGVIKSLGAWGGDMMMAVSEMPSDHMRSYFQKKGDITYLFRIRIPKWSPL
jgi:hypothetical protein